jgi:hypothetical protein
MNQLNFNSATADRTMNHSAHATKDRTPSRKGWITKAADAGRSTMIYLSVAVLGVGLVATTGALNGGTIPPASVFTPLKTWLQANFLGSDWVLVIGMVALVGLVWGLLHGKGWGGASVVLGIVTAALLGPQLVLAAATATRDPVVAVQAVQATPTRAAVSHTLTLTSAIKPAPARI